MTLKTIFAAMALAGGLVTPVNFPEHEPVPTYLFSSMAFAPGAKIGLSVFTGDGARIREGFRLYMQGDVDTMLITGFDTQAFKTPATLAAAMNIAVSRDLSGITLEQQSINTCQNAEATARWAADHKLDTVVGLTSDFHAARALYLLKSYLPRTTTVSVWDIRSDATRRAWRFDAIKLLASQLGICGIAGYQIPDI